MQSSIIINGITEDGNVSAIQNFTVIGSNQSSLITFNVLTNGSGTTLSEQFLNALAFYESGPEIDLYPNGAPWSYWRDSISGIIGEGQASLNVNGNWYGSLDTLDIGNGYWLKTNHDNTRLPDRIEFRGIIAYNNTNILNQQGQLAQDIINEELDPNIYSWPWGPDLGLVCEEGETCLPEAYLAYIDPETTTDCSAIAGPCVDYSATCDGYQDVAGSVDEPVSCQPTNYIPPNQTCGYYGDCIETGLSCGSYVNDENITCIETGLNCNFYDCISTGLECSDYGDCVADDLTCEQYGQCVANDLSCVDYGECVDNDLTCEQYGDCVADDLDCEQYGACVADDLTCEQYGDCVADDLDCAVYSDTCIETGLSCDSYEGCMEEIIFEDIYLPGYVGDMQRYTMIGCTLPPGEYDLRDTLRDSFTANFEIGDQISLFLCTDSSCSYDVLSPTGFVAGQAVYTGSNWMVLSGNIRIESGAGIWIATQNSGYFGWLKYPV